jgi:hypothetical protein
LVGGGRLETGGIGRVVEMARMGPPVSKWVTLYAVPVQAFRIVSDTW